LTVRIAVIDDSPHLVSLYQSVLAQRGYQVYAHEENEQGLQEIKKLQPDLIILGNIRIANDVEFAFLRQLRNQPETHLIPIILATTGARLIEQSIVNCQNHNLTILSKPFDWHTLTTCVEAVMPATRQKPRPDDAGV
jgi:DNA-binding response OmpR family regulator